MKKLQLMMSRYSKNLQVPTMSSLTSWIIMGSERANALTWLATIVTLLEYYSDAYTLECYILIYKN